MVKVAQAMDTIAMHACPSCLDTDFGFGLAASTDWEVRSPLNLPYVSPTPPPYIPYISPASRLRDRGEH